MSNLNLNTETLILEYEGGDTPYMEYMGQKHFVSSGGYLDDGYIGVTSISLQERINQHRMDRLKDKIKPTTKYEALLTDLDKELAKDYERQLRPYPNMGWNIRKGGGGMYEGRFFTLYHIYDPQKPLGLTKRFMKWIFRRLKGAIRRTGAVRVNPSSGRMRPEGQETFTVGDETPFIPEGQETMIPARESPRARSGASGKGSVSRTMRTGRIAIGSHVPERFDSRTMRTERHRLASLPVNDAPGNAPQSILGAMVGISVRSCHHPPQWPVARFMALPGGGFRWQAEPDSGIPSAAGPMAG